MPSQGCPLDSVLPFVSGPVWWSLALHCLCVSGEG